MDIVCAIKKRPGRLVLEDETLRWVPQGGDAISLPLSNVQGMQATPPTAAKLRIKLSPKDGAPLMLEFGGADSLEKARSELQGVIKQFRDGQSASASPAPGAGAAGAGAAGAAAPDGAAAAAAAKPKPSGPKKKKLSLDPSKLVNNLDLQRGVLRQDPELMRTFEQVVIQSRALTNAQFWWPRIELLVTAAQQQAQAPGSYNVLSTIKPTTSSDNRVNINLTREKIADLFDQYPLVRRAYNENVPKLSEGEFWQRFFMSRLFLVLRGEKVSATHTSDAVFDPYIAVLHELQEKQRQRRQTEESEHPAPVFVNVEANAENNPETYGNNIVTTAGGSTRTLIRSMNGLSQRLLRGKRRRDGDDFDDGDEPDMRSELQLRDLEPDAKPETDVGLHIDVQTDPAGQQADPEQCARDNARLLGDAPASVDLRDLLGDSASLEYAHTLVATLTPHPELVAATGTVSGDVSMVYATTTEFLKQFWYAYNNKREEAAGLRTYLENSLARIDAVQGLPALQAVVDSVHVALGMPL